MLERVKKRFGSIAIEKGFITPDQVVEALTIQVKENTEKKRFRPIGDILHDLGYLNSSQLSEVLDAKFERRFGDIAISKGLISLEQFIGAMTIQVEEENQKGIHRLLGEILVESGYINNVELKNILRAMKTE